MYLLMMRMFVLVCTLDASINSVYLVPLQIDSTDNINYFSTNSFLCIVLTHNVNVCMSIRINTGVAQIQE